MTALPWIVGSGLLMSAIALVGSVTLLVGQAALERLHWHHCRRAGAHRKQPLTYLLLIGDGLHNFIGGLAIAGTFLIDVRLGVTAWLAAAAHEVPQELGVSALSSTAAGCASVHCCSMRCRARHSCSAGS